ncbi:DUF938 domain-containing protein [Muricoccus aerilatus]|uniref:DUF938 domain-containing protein n=1 Tax=Muricoccus aerilatus TaxID=452982 RepID=UPI0005C22DAB|nr:DUF938 domain-containing protein [Roseomonas aerilata]
MSGDARRHAPAAARNREPILAVLREWLPAEGMVLEVASGTGEHAAHFAAALPQLVFQPSDPDPALLASIDAWAEDAANIRPALRLDAAAAEWPVGAVDAMLCINMIHIAPWSAAEGLVRGAAARLSAGAPLILYGPYRRGGAHTAPSNAEFDANLRSRNPAWGVRDLEAVAELAGSEGFGAPELREMPANNLMLRFVRA